MNVVRRYRYTLGLAALVTFIVVVVGTILGTWIDRAVKTDAAVTDDVIAVIYIGTLTLFYVLVSWLPRRHSQRQRVTR
jgi:ABC-type antimicrobial peptide transport system permease subunit